MTDIQFFYLQQVPSFRHRNKLKTFLSNQGNRRGRSIESLNIIFCDDEYLLSINRQFLQHDYYTDIITFDLTPSKKGPIQSEIYISIDRVRENALSHSTSFNLELHRVIFHGLLHLLGYKDKSPKDVKQMRSMEDELLSDYFDSLDG